jgi:predicted RNA-binding protein YlxR (DUF448 family)
LVRIALHRADTGTLPTAVIDACARMPGRGAYLCRSAQGIVPDAGCIARAKQRRAIPRALRAAVSLDHKLVESMGQ